MTIDKLIGKRVVIERKSLHATQGKRGIHDYITGTLTGAEGGFLSLKEWSDSVHDYNLNCSLRTIGIGVDVRPNGAPECNIPAADIHNVYELDMTKLDAEESYCGPSSDRHMHHLMRI